MKDATYSEQEVRRWLGWLARGMQKHGQSVFLMERLQPDWLPNSWQRWVYLLLTRLLQSGIVIFLLELTDRAKGLPDALPAQWIAVIILTAGLSAALGEGILRNHRRGTGVVTVFVLWLLAANLPCAVFGSTASGLLVTIILGIRAARGFGDEIQSTESLTWSWRGFLNGLVFGKMLKAAFGRGDAESTPAGRGPERIQAWAARGGLGLYGVAVLATLYDHLQWYRLHGGNWEDFVDDQFLLYPNLLTGIFSAISRRAIEMKVEPNEGMRRSLRTSLQFLLMCLIPWSALNFLLVKLVAPGKSFAVDWVASSGIDLLEIFGVASAAWFGGMDMIAHYTLRVMLCANGKAPLNYARFLDYAAMELGFMQKVGGGYMFMHRHLLEYFAGGGDEGVATGGASGAEQPVS